MILKCNSQHNIVIVIGSATAILLYINHIFKQLSTVNVIITCGLDFDDSLAKTSTIGDNIRYKHQAIFLF